MLENPVYPSGTRRRICPMSSDNPDGAENQQERLIELRGWVIGFVDYDNDREHLYRDVVRRRKDLLERIIPFFRRHPMRTAKQQNFERFAACVERIAAGEHLSRDGLIEIVRIAETMNRRKPRQELIRILR